jgi:Ran-interacting Mog1 protein
MEERPLFGGAIVCRIPSEWIDISDIRQVPDHQECWQDTREGRLLVIEILERKEIPDDKAAEYFFRDLAEYNQSNLVEFVEMSSIPKVDLRLDNVCFGCGSQTIARNNHLNVNELHNVWIEICVVRLAKYKTDIVLSISTPADPSENLSISPATALFVDVASSFQIRDWSLFS